MAIKKSILKLSVLILLVGIIPGLLSVRVSAQDEFDEFKPIKEQELAGNGQDEFQEFDPDSSAVIKTTNDKNKSRIHSGYYYAIGALIFTILAGIFFQFEQTRKLRYLFLLISLVVLGFYRGGCPCMIGGFQDLWLALFGRDIVFHRILWFVGLIPITYIFGRVWCGWVCPLGAFQEFLYKENSIKTLKSARFQKILKISQYVFFFALIFQILITRTNLYIRYDPFKVAFNMFSTNTTGYILVALLLISSLLIYRPFCRGVCPVGLVLGWINRMPGAWSLNINKNCVSCQLCARECPSHAIDKDCNIHTSECIACGRCQEKCSRDAIDCGRKSDEK